MENVQRFQAAIKNYGVPQEESFQTADLFERRNIPQVTLCLNALGRIFVRLTCLSRRRTRCDLSETIEYSCYRCENPIAKRLTKNESNTSVRDDSSYESCPYLI